MNTNLDFFIYILPFVFALHNFEEVLSMEKWTKSIPSFIHPTVTTRQFAIAVGLFSVVGFVIIMTKSFYPTEKHYLYLVCGFAGMLFLNVFFPHLISAIYLKKYSPGIVTGLLINLPLVLLIFRSIYNSQKMSFGQIGFSIIIGGLIGIVLAVLFLKIGSLIDNSLTKNLKETK